MTLGKVKQACCAAKLWCDVLSIFMYQSKLCLKKKKLGSLLANTNNDLYRSQPNSRYRAFCLAS